MLAYTSMELCMASEEFGGILLDVLDIPDLGRLSVGEIFTAFHFIFHKICHVPILKVRNVRA